jgi:obg-like ATPase 1
MPPKKGEPEVPVRLLLGRLGTNLKAGIVGLPNVGKSTTFNVLTKSEAPAENFPFCTKDPNEARVPVPDERFDWLCEYHKPPSRVPAFLNVVDIAGLVKGAHEGLGLGNAFLSNISACDAIFHVCRAFSDDEIIHVEGDVNPVRDLDIIAQELRLKDVAALDKVIAPIEKAATRGGDKKKKQEYDMLMKFKEHLLAGKDIRNGQWDRYEIELLNTFLLLTSKPVVYLVNLSEKDFLRKKNKWLGKIKAWVDEHEEVPIIIPYSAEFELTLAMLPDDEARNKHCEETGMQSMMPKIIKAGYTALNLMYFFTAGKDEVKAWTVQRGARAPQAAGRIHSDFEKGFIMAEVMNFEDFKEAGSEAAVKAAGKYRQQGKTYEVQDGDIIFFKFNVSSSGKGKK